MNNWKEYTQDNEKEIYDLLFGRKVTKISEDELLLDNGIILEVSGNEGCGGCGNGWYDITELNGCDNAITNIEFEETNEGWKDIYRIFVFTVDKRITLVQAEGSDNGYYGTGYHITVKIK